MLQCSSGGGFSLVRGGSPWSRGGLLGPGGFSLVPGGLPGPEGGSPWSGGVAWSQGGLPGRGGSPWSRGGGSPWSRGGFSEDPPVDRITDTCKNITLATTSLRPVKMPLNQ